MTTSNDSDQRFGLFQDWGAGIRDWFISRKLRLGIGASIETVQSDGSRKTISTAELDTLDGITATTEELNAAADVSTRLVSVADAATYTVLAANSGKPHVIPDLTADCTFTLPTPASGLEYEFIYGGVAADAQDWILDTGSDTNFYLGGVGHLDTNAGAVGTEVAAVAGDGNSNSKLTVLTPNVGTRVKLICDGINWIACGLVASVSAPTYADQ